MKLKLQSKEDVRLAIRRRGAEIAAAMTDKELFTSPEFYHYANRLADFILRNHRLYELKIQYDPSETADVAYTDGKKIFLNTGNSIAKNPKLLERRFKVNMGILFHECAHKLFLDFAASNKILKQIQGGKLYGRFPENLPQQYAEAYKELQDVVSSPYAPAIAAIYAHITNCIDDGHDEHLMKRCFGGFIAEFIETAGEEQMKSTPTVEQAIEQRVPEYNIYSMLILEYAKYGSYAVGNPTAEVEKYMNAMAEIESVIDAALLEDNYRKRWDYINRLVLFIWHTVREQFPKDLHDPTQSPAAQQSAGQNSSGQGSNSQGSSSQSNGSQDGNSQSSNASHSSTQAAPQGKEQGNNNAQNGNSSDPQSQNSTPPTPEEVKAALEQMAQQVQSATGANPVPTGCKNTAISLDEISGASSGSNGDAAKLLQSIAQGQAREQIQSELDAAQMAAIRNKDLPLVHGSISQPVNRHFGNTEAHKYVYEEIYKEVAPIVRSLSKEMLALLRELNEESVQHHRRIGPIVEVTEAYRPDQAFFAKKNLPADLPDMAVCVLIDESASMKGTKMECAKKAAILLERFAANIGIPCMIAGHHTSGASSVLNIYTDFLSTNEESDRCALAGIEATGCNRDGLAIRTCANLLAQRQEDVRLMVVISDGAPNHTGYYGEPARKDISDTVKEFRRKGLLIYGAAIDKDQDVIEKIYGKGFLSIQTLTALPKTLVRLVRQQII